MAAITAILARYPEEVITAVTHPTNLPSKKDWLPTVKEVVDACNEAMEPIIQHQARLKRIRDQMEARAREDAGIKPTMAQLKERFGENWGFDPPPEKAKSNFKAPTADQLREHYAKHGIGFTPKDNQLGDNQD